MFCSGFMSKFKTIWQKVDKTLLDYAAIGLHITTTLKSWLSSDVAIILSQLLPSTIGNDERLKLLKIISIAASKLDLIVHPDLQTLPVAYNDVHNILEALGKKPIDERNATLIKLASLITKELDNRYDTHIYDTAVQVVWSLGQQSQA